MAECIQCGKCCHCDFFAYTRPQDLARWKEQGREDILQIIKNESPVWEGRQAHIRQGRKAPALLSFPGLGGRKTHLRDL